MLTTAQADFLRKFRGKIVKITNEYIGDIQYLEDRYAEELGVFVDVPADDMDLLVEKVVGVSPRDRPKPRKKPRRDAGLPFQDCRHMVTTLSAELEKATRDLVLELSRELGITGRAGEVPKAYFEGEAGQMVLGVRQMLTRARNKFHDALFLSEEDEVSQLAVARDQQIQIGNVLYSCSADDFGFRFLDYGLSLVANAYHITARILFRFEPGSAARDEHGGTFDAMDLVSKFGKHPGYRKNAEDLHLVHPSPFSLISFEKNASRKRRRG